MGFSIYWNQLPVSQAVWDTFIKRALNLVKRRRTGKIMLENPYSHHPQKNINGIGITIIPMAFYVNFISYCC